MSHLFRSTIFRFAVLVTALGLMGPALAEEKALTNDDVLSLAKAGLGDDLVIAKIQQVPEEAFDVSTEALIALKNADLSKAVIDAMIKRVSQRAGTPATSSPKPSALPVAKPRKAGDPSKGEPCVANFTTEGGYWKGEAKMSFQDYPELEASVPLFDRLSQSVASGGWQVTLSNRDSGTVSGYQEIRQILADGTSKATLNVLLSTLESGGIRVETTLMVPAGTKVTDKDAKKVFCRILQSVSQ